MSKIIKELFASRKKSPVIVHLTDTYFLKESKIGKKIDLPGFGRIHKILELLSNNFKDTNILFLHSGDFLFPSFLSNFFKGKQMVEVLNQCNLKYCTLGNHDFDGGDDVLKSRINESQFQYVITNMVPAKNLTKKIIQYGVWPEESPYVGIIGVSGKMTIDKATKKLFKLKKLETSLKQTLLEIQKKFPSVRLLVVLSHMSDDEDLQLKKLLNSLWARHSIILGGHDHNRIVSHSPKSEKCMLVKGQSNARTIQIIKINEQILNKKNYNMKKNLLVLDSKDFVEFSVSKKIERKIQSWYKKLRDQNKLPPNKTVKIFPKGVILDSTEVSLRQGTTNFGNFIADCLKKYTCSDIAMINSGHFRSDRLFSEKLTLQDLYNTFVMEEKGNIIVTELTKKECALFFKHAYSQTGKGKVLQFSKSTLQILKKSKNNSKFKIALMTDMIYADEDGFGKILAQSRKISISKLRKMLKKDILSDRNLLEGIIQTANQVTYDSKSRMKITDNKKSTLFAYRSL